MNKPQTVEDWKMSIQYGFPGIDASLFKTVEQDISMMYCLKHNYYR